MNVAERFLRGITRITPEDAADVARFKLKQFGEGSRQTNATLDRWLGANPWADDDGPGVWIARRKDAIVGIQCEIPYELQVGTDRRRVAWAVDIRVEEEWRLRGIGPGLIATQLQQHPLVTSLNLSDHGFAAYTQLGWTDLGIVPVYVRPLDAGRMLRAPQAPVPDRLRRLAPVAGPTLNGVDAAARATLRAARVRAVEVPRLDERVDEVWARSQPHYPVLARRDLASLAWQIDGRPDRDRLVRHYLMRGRHTLGYVVVRPALTEDEPVAVVVDYLAPPRWVAPLLLTAGWAARRAGNMALAVRTRNQLADRGLRTAGFVRRDSITDDPIRFMVCCRDEPGICALVSDPDSWFVTSADSDLDHDALV